MVYHLTLMHAEMSVSAAVPLLMVPPRQVEDKLRIVFNLLTFNTELLLVSNIFNKKGTQTSHLLAIIRNQTLRGFSF